MTSFANNAVGTGSHPSPRPTATLRPLETIKAGYGSAELTPEFLPSPGRQLALKERRIAKAVEHVVTAPAPTMASVAEALGVSRATAYRILGMPAFQAMLREALKGRLAVSVQKAFSVVEQTMETGSPALKLRAAQWLAERHDKLSTIALSNAKPEPDLSAKLDLLNVAMQAINESLPNPRTPEQDIVRKHIHAVLLRALTAKPAEDELLDAALETDHQ